MTVTEQCPHAKVQRSDCLVCVLEDNRRETEQAVLRRVRECVLEIMASGPFSEHAYSPLLDQFEKGGKFEIEEEVG